MSAAITLSRDQQDAIFREMAGHAVESPEWVKLRNSVLPSYYPAAVKRAGFHAGHGVDEDDLVNLAVMGLLRATEDYDVESGNGFMTYAQFWMDKHCTKAIQSQFPPLSGSRERRRNEFSRLREAERELAHKHKRSPTIEEIAELAGVEESEAAAAMATRNVRSTNVADGEPQLDLESRRTTTAAEEIEQAEENALFLTRLEQGLTASQFSIVSDIHGLRGPRLTFQAAADRRKCSRQWACAFYNSAMRRVCCVLLEHGYITCDSERKRVRKMLTLRVVGNLRMACVSTLLRMNSAMLAFLWFLAGGW